MWEIFLGAGNGFSQNTLDIRRVTALCELREAARGMVGETLRCSFVPLKDKAQGDSGGAAFIVQIHLLKFIIGCGRDQSAITGAGVVCSMVLSATMGGGSI